MSNYTQSTNFATKDALPSGDPLKIVKGTEINTEFNNISVAIATKADLVSPTFTGTPAAPTASVSTDTTQIATTAFVQDVAAAIKEALFPVGSIYVNAGVSTNPATLLGFGTWTAFGAGRVMVGLDGSDASFDALEETGGSKDATLVSHNHTATVTDPGHAHNLDGQTIQGGVNQSPSGVTDTNTRPLGLQTASATTGVTVGISTQGSSATNANLQPYITVAMWKRTA